MAATPAATSVEAVTSPHRDDTASVPIWTPSTTIIDLPNEILRDIFLAIDGEFSKSLYSLSLTCKHFRAIVEEHCKPEYNLRGKELDHALELLEQLIDRPSFKRSIRVLNLQYQHAFLPTETSAETLTLANRLGLAALQKELWEFDWDDDPSNMAAALLAASVPNLETCHVSMPQEGTGAFDHLVQYLTMVDRPFESLRNLILTNTANTAVSFQEDVFHTICALPALVRLQIRGLSFDGWSHARPSSERLEYLDMDESQRNFNRYYQKKLEPLKALEHLRLRLTDCQLSMENEDRPRYVENPYFLEHSLETLELFSNERYCMPTKRHPSCPNYLQCPRCAAFGI